MRKTYHFDEKLGEMVEGPSAPRGSTSILDMPDIPDFVSPIDGKVVNGRKGLREHNKIHNVTNMADYTNQWAEQAKVRESMYTGDSKFDRARRLEKIKAAVEKHYK